MAHSLTRTGPAPFGLSHSSVSQAKPLVPCAELAPADVEVGALEMLARDHARMRLAGGNLAEAAIRVIHDYDGLHRLSLAVAGWAEAIASEGDRG